MNSRYRGRTVTKLLNLIISVYNFSNNGSETENSSIKTSTLAREHVSRQNTLAREHGSTQSTLAREQSTKARRARWHVSTFLACRTHNLAGWHCIHLYTKKIIYLSRFVSAMSAFAPIKISYSNM